jgi:hypothetical protein
LSSRPLRDCEQYVFCLAELILDRVDSRHDPVHGRPKNESSLLSAVPLFDKLNVALRDFVEDREPIDRNAVIQTAAFRSIRECSLA